MDSGRHSCHKKHFVYKASSYIKVLVLIPCQVWYEHDISCWRGSRYILCYQFAANFSKKGYWSKWRKGLFFLISLIFLFSVKRCMSRCSWYLFSLFFLLNEACYFKVRIISKAFSFFPLKNQPHGLNLQIIKCASKLCFNFLS